MPVTNNKDYGAFSGKSTHNSSESTHIGKLIKQYDKNGIFIQSFNSNREASLKLKIDKSSICAASKGDRKSAGGFIWKH
jgi:hypothetical protein